MNAAREPNQPLFFQLYVNRKREIAAELIKKVNNLKMDAIFMTGDAPVGGKRERDLRLKGEFEGPAGGVSEKSEGTQGVSQAMFAGVDPDLNWEDIKWIRSQSDLPIIVKGIQCVEVGSAHRLGFRQVGLKIRMHCWHMRKEQMEF